MSSNSKSSSNSQPRPVLKVVPPETMKPSVASPSLPPAAEPVQLPPQATIKRQPSRYFRYGILFGLVAAGIILSQMPVPNYISGETTVTSADRARQAVTMPYAGTVSLAVRPNQSVVPGQLIAKVTSEQLDTEIAEAEIALEEANAALNNAQQNRKIVQNTYQEVQATADAVRIAADQMAADSRAIASQNPPPMMASLQADIESSQAEYDENEKNIERYQGLVDEGVYSSEKLDQATTRKKQIKAEIENKLQQIRDFEKQTQERLERQQAEVTQRETAVSTARESVVAAEVEVRDKQQLVTKQEQKLRSLRSQLDKLEIKATVAGTVVTPDLDLLQNQAMPLGKELLEIVDLAQLAADVKVSQQDYSLVRSALEGSNLQATFHPRNTVGHVYKATVEPQNIHSIATAEMSQEPSELTVKILIDNHEQRLRPGMRGTTHINIGKTPLYQRVQREFLRLVPVEKWKFF